MAKPHTVDVHVGARKRIGWIDSSASTYYRVDQIELSPDQSTRPKQGEVGMLVEQGRLFDAVVRAERNE